MGFAGGHMYEMATSIKWIAAAKYANGIPRACPVFGTDPIQRS
jgi:hypothetical protein